MAKSSFDENYQQVGALWIQPPREKGKRSSLSLKFEEEIMRGEKIVAFENIHKDKNDENNNQPDFRLYRNIKESDTTSKPPEKKSDVPF